MVMASGPGRRPSVASSPREVGVARGAGASEAGALHDRLVAYVHALDNAHEARTGVWVEHSYARAGAGAGEAGAVRVLLARREPPDLGDYVDVEGAPPPPPEPPAAPDDASSGSGSADDDDADDDWEARLAALAPGAEHARLADGAVEALRRVRLARLAGGRAGAALARREEARALRRALAPLWLGGGGAQPRPPQWLHAALTAVAPRPVRREYERLVAELRRMAPRLADRLMVSRPPTTPITSSMIDQSMEAEREVGPESGPWLVWLGGGRWPRLLRSLVHTRVVDAGAAGGAPDAWCAAVAAAARVAVADVLAEAGSRPVVVGGAGGWATLAATLAGGAARGLLALSPALRTAEGEAGAAGAWGAGAALVVAGAAAAASWRGALAEALGAGQRLLLVAGADDALRLPARHKRRLRLDQRALDAHIAEECARWVLEVSEAAEPAPALPPARGAESEEEEYAHLPAAAPPAPAAGVDQRSIEIVEGRVVTRVSGSTPLALLPPSRAERRAERRRAEPPPPLHAADIMQLPIVFADDERALDAVQPERGAGAVTVRSGAGAGAAGAAGAGFKYTRVIVAKRGAAAGARPLLLRRGVRLVPRSDR